MIKETFKQAVQNVLSNKVRTFLTMLGIIIGVMAVIVIVGLGNGMTHMMQDFYSDMGSDILSVNIMTASTRSVEVDDVYRIINEKPEYYKGLSPIASVGDTLRVAGEKYRRTYISGVNEDYTTINNYKVAKGRGIQYTDLIDNKNICVIGDYVDRRIFGGNGLGSTLKVGASEYRIVGVLEGRSKPASQYEGGNDDIVLIPYTTLMSVNNTSSVSQYYVVLQDADHSDEAQEFLQSRLKKLVSKDDYVYVMSLSRSHEADVLHDQRHGGRPDGHCGHLAAWSAALRHHEHRCWCPITDAPVRSAIRKALGAQESTILDPVRRGGRRHVGAGRLPRHRAGLRRLGHYQPDPSVYPDGYYPERHPLGGRSSHRRGHLLRHRCPVRLPAGPPCRQPEPHRSAQI